MSDQDRCRWPPDWRNPHHYPNADENDRELWAWEFLRRNETYQKEWQMLSASNPVSSSRLPNREFWVGDERWLEFANRWGIIGFPPSPSESRPGLTFFDSSLKFGTSVYCEELADQVQLAPRGPEEIVLRLPLNRTLNALRTALEPILSREMENYKKKFGGKAISPVRMDKYLNYLRILDAIQAGASKQEIALTLYPFQDLNSKIDSISYEYDSALQLVESAYLSIPYLTQLEQQLDN